MRDRDIGFNITFTPCYDHASGLTAAAEIRPKEFQNQQAVPIRSLSFWPVDGRPHPVSVSMVMLVMGWTIRTDIMSLRITIYALQSPKPFQMYSRQNSGVYYTFYCFTFQRSKNICGFAGRRGKS